METLQYTDIVKYVYGQLDNCPIKECIENAIKTSNKEVIQLVSDIRMTKGFRNFETPHEHITTINIEAAAHTAMLAEKYGLSLKK